MGVRMYRTVRAVYRFFAHRMETTWEVPFDGEPCVFVCNHERASGPIRIALQFPLIDDSKIWIFADPLHRETVPAYVRQDNWWNKESRLAPFYNAVIPPIVSVILPPILRSAPHVPVYHDIRAVSTMRESLRLLREEKKHLIIFPEIPTGYHEHETAKINEGFLTILQRYYRTTGKVLRIWPIHFDREGHAFRVKAPIDWNPEVPLEEQVPWLSRQILDGIFEREHSDISEVSGSAAQST